jgi:hypothetical protein
LRDDRRSSDEIQELLAPLLGCIEQLGYLRGLLIPAALHRPDQRPVALLGFDRDLIVVARQL